MYFAEHKACFYHDLAYGDFKDLSRRTASEKLLRNKVFDNLILLKVQIMMDIKEVLLQWFINLLMKSQKELIKLLLVLLKLKLC